MSEVDFARVEEEGLRSVECRREHAGDGEEKLQLISHGSHQPIYGC